MTMTIPMVVMLVSAILWFIASTPAETVPWWRSWFIDVCRILFAAAALVTLLGVTGKPVF